MTLRRSVFSVPKMDCASEEQMIRGALDGTKGVQAIECNLGERTVGVVHEGEPEDIEARLVPLGLGAKLKETRDAGEDELAELDPVGERRTLRILFAINGTMFVVGMVAGIIAESTGLIADSLDMFADATVFGLSLYAVGRAHSTKVRAAHVAGWLQVILGIATLGEIGRRFIQGGEPEAAVMMAVAATSFAANAFCLRLMTKHRDGGVHMKASAIFLTNDVLANLGVIAAGVAVKLTASHYPDLVIGTIIAFVVLWGARRILRLR